MLSDAITKLLEKKGFADLTEIQKKAIPVVEAGKNCLVIAPTGHGKTETALLPLLQKAAENKEFGVQVLYITPLRALNRDLLERITWWARELKVTLAVRHGDTTPKERVAQTKLPPQVLITTPESLQAMLCAPKMGQHLLKINAVVIDEVHELFNDKRGAQLSIALERLVEKKKSAGAAAEFQRIGLSATVGNVDEVKKFLCGRRECAVVSLSALRKFELRVSSPKPGVEDAELAERLFLDAGAVARLRKLDEMVKQRKTLIFVNTRSVAEILSSRLTQLEASIAVHHGSLAKEVRIATEQKFKKSEVRGLVSTSSLELGIDIGDVEMVAQFMSPRQVQRLMQRVGRSGHAVAKTPRGEIIASDADDVIESAVICRRAKEGLLEKESMQEKALDVLANQVAGLAMDFGVIRLGKALEIVSRAGPYLELREEELAQVAVQLKSERILRFDEDKKEIEKNTSTRMFYYSNLSMIPSEKKFRVRNAATNGIVGTLDEGFAAGLEQGGMFITKGVPWKVLDVGEEEVVVEPSETFEAAVPDWEGEEIPVPFEIAQEAAALRARIAREGAREIAKEYGIEEKAVESVREFLSAQSPVPDEKNVLIECAGEACVIHLAGGSLSNAAIAKALAAKLTQKFGASVRADNDAYRILLVCPRPVKAEEVRQLLAQMGNLRAILDPSISRASIFKWKFVHVARAFGLIGEHATVSARFIERLANTPVYREALREIYANYVDVEGAQKLLACLREGKLKATCRNGDISPIGRLALDRTRAGELVAPIEPSSEILRAFKDSVLAETKRFMCTYCGKITYAKLKDLPTQPTCPHCWSTMLAPIERGEEKILKKEKWKRSAEEEKKSAEIVRAASLMTAYGKRAAWALAVYGVGVETAARILAKIIREENSFFTELLEAQKRFIRTKRYWKIGG